MEPTTVLVHGLGNIGRHVIDCLASAPDLRCLGVVRSPASVGTKRAELRGIPDFPSLAALEKDVGRPAVAVIAAPSRLVPEVAAGYLQAGLHTVDSFDIHARIPEVVAELDAVAKKAGRVAVTAAGWDPGTDSVLRALFLAMAPKGTTFTNFGRGRSMGHSVAARAIAGVRDATALTIPLGGGRHSRLVYILPEPEASADAIAALLRADDYFRHDAVDIRFVGSEEELAAVADNAHGVLMERIGASGSVSNQRFAFDMRVDNPALTAQVMAACARAAGRVGAGCYTLIDIPPVALLAGERMENVAKLV